MKRALCTVLALVFFASAVAFPWIYWEAARLVMRDEAPPYLAWLVSKRYADMVWWLMGLTLIVWAPLSIALGGALGYFFVMIGFAKPKQPSNRPRAPIRHG